MHWLGLGCFCSERAPEICVACNMQYVCILHTKYQSVLQIMPFLHTKHKKKTRFYKVSDLEQGCEVSW